MKTLYIGLGILLCSYCSVSNAQWIQEKNNYPAGIDDAAISFVIGDSIYIGGGSNGSTAFYKYDPATGEWASKAPLPHPNGFGNGFAIAGKGYMAFGQPDPMGKGQAQLGNDVWQYDPKTNEWSPEKGKFPGDVRDAAFVFVIGNKAYAGGGVNSAGIAYSDFYSFDPSTGAWDTLGELPDNLFFNSTFVIGNYGYLATGVGSAGELSEAWVYDPSSDSWNPIAQVPGSPRESAVAFTLNGVGYVGLGQSNFTDVFTDFYSYYPAKNLWSPVTSFPATHGRAWAVGLATSNAAVVGLGTYFDGNDLIANSDMWKFSTNADVASKAIDTSLEVFPNPASNYVSVVVPNLSGEATVSVRNSLGKECMKTSLHSEKTLNIADLTSGMYEIEVTNGNIHSFERFIKD